MEFKGKWKFKVFTILAFYPLLFIHIDNQFSVNDSIFIGQTILFLAIALFVEQRHYTFVIDGAQLHYTVTLYGKVVRRVTLQPEDIAKIHFQRAYYFDKRATIISTKGQIEIHRFMPDTVYDALEHYCYTHDIAVRKDGNYLIVRHNDARMQSKH